LRGLNIGVSQDYSINLSSYLIALYPRTHPEAVKQTDEYLALISGDIPKEAIAMLNPFTSLDEIREIYGYELFQAVSHSKPNTNLERAYHFFNRLLQDEPELRIILLDNLEKKKEYLDSTTFF